MTSPIIATRLRTEFLADPIGIDVARPRFFWWIGDDRAGAKQTAYRIRVASTAERLSAPDLWDSGKIASDAQTHIPYVGKPLGSRTRAVWTVTLWDADGNEGSASAPARFEIGLRERSDWVAQWIGTPLVGTNSQSPPVPWLRRSFTIDKPVVSARLYVTALGLYQAHLNGQRIGDDYFRPGWTEYRRRVQYQTYDVTALVTTGENAIGALLGDGWYAGRVGFYDRALCWGDRPALLAQLEVTHADGTRTTITTDDQWEWKRSPILASDFMAGEEYDARMEDANWCRVDRDAAGWQPVTAIAVDGAIALTAQPNESVRVTQELTPVADPKRVGAPGNRTGFLYDLGQNFAGNVRLKIKGPAGATVRLRFAEMLKDDGTLYTDNYRSARVTDFYTLRGDANGETYEPTFTFHGFRYVAIEILNWHLNAKLGPTIDVPTRDSITGLVIHSDTAKTGEFSCSHDLLNKLQSNITWGQRSNFLEAPTDCPQRDERLGWTGDAQVFASTAAFNMDVAAFFTKWTQDCDDAQFPTGQLPVVVPTVADLNTMGDGSAGWSDARVICPWAMYAAYGDQTLLEKHYPAMVKWIEWQAATSKDGGVRSYEGFDQHRGFGDWLALDRSDGSPFGATPLDFIGTAYFARSSGIMADVATLLGKKADALRFAQMRTNAVEAFNRHFVTPVGTLASDGQTAYLMALGFDLLPEAHRPAAVERLVKLLEQKQWHLSTGFLGTPLLLPVLTRFGKLDVAYKVLLQTTYPGWLYTVSIGATTMWERWNSWTPDKGFGDVGMNSFNHYAYGAVGRWMYDQIGGIALDESRPAYKHVRIAPTPGGGLTSGRAAIDSLHGRIESSWTIEGDRFTLNATVPANVTATVVLPDGKTHEVAAGRHTFEARIS